NSNWEYIVDVQAKEARKRLWTSRILKIALKVMPCAAAFDRESQEVLGGARIFDVEISEKSPNLRAIREANRGADYTVVEGLNRKLLDRSGHRLTNCIVVQKLPYRMS